jgi:hypothetical protein
MMRRVGEMASRDKLATTVSRSQVLRHTRWSDVAVQSLRQAGHKLIALVCGQSSGRAGCENKVAVKINDQGVGGSGEERPALGSDTQDVWAWFLDKLLGVTGVNHGDVETAPLVDSDAKSYRLGGHGEHGRVVADENDAACGRDGGLDYTHDVGNGETSKQWPHGEVLEAGRGGRELVAQSVVLHVDADKVVQARGREAEDARDFLGVEKVGGLVPVNPHASQVVTKQVVERVAGEERQAVGNPIRLVGVVVVVRLGTLAKITDRLGALVVGSGPDSERDTVKGLGGILLENESMVNAVRLAASRADLDIVREAGLVGG